MTLHFHGPPSQPDYLQSDIFSGSSGSVRRSSHLYDSRSEKIEHCDESVLPTQVDKLSNPMVQPRINCLVQASTLVCSTTAQCIPVNHTIWPLKRRNYDNIVLPSSDNMEVFKRGRSSLVIIPIA